MLASFGVFASFSGKISLFIIDRCGMKSKVSARCPAGGTGKTQSSFSIKNGRKTTSAPQSVKKVEVQEALP
ncbi:MAG: hypothetical protein SO010_05110, partial [Candidatus Limiplasma sp.]|nr:hypothetical protein [Candidatus Limiplasma sp.]